MQTTASAIISSMVAQSNPNDSLTVPLFLLVQLRQLPEVISALTKLRALSVSSNRLWQLPSGITNCSALKLLDCSHNQLDRLPQGMRQLTNLRSLKLTHNRYACVGPGRLCCVIVAGRSFLVAAWSCQL